MPTLTITDPTTGQEVLADDVNNRRTQIETVVNALDDTNFGANWPTRTGTAISPDLSHWNGSFYVQRQGEMGLIRLGSSEYQFAHLVNRDFRTGGVEKPLQFISTWKPLISQHEETDVSFVPNGTFQNFPAGTINTGFIPHAKLFRDGGFRLVLKVAGHHNSILVSDPGNQSTAITRLDFYQISSGDTSSGSVLFQHTASSKTQGGSQQNDHWWDIVAVPVVIPAMTKDHLVVNLLKSLSGVPSFLSWTFERISIQYAWITSFS